MNKYIYILIALLIPLASFAQLGNTINTVGGNQAMTAPSNSVSSSTNGYIWTATGLTGQGKWSRGRTSFRAYLNNNSFICTNGAVTTVTFDVVATNTANMTYFNGILTLPKGEWLIGGQVSTVYQSGSIGIQAFLFVDGNVYHNWPWCFPNAAAAAYYVEAGGSSPVYSSGSTTVSINARIQGTTTNLYSGSSLSYMWAEYLGE